MELLLMRAVTNVTGYMCRLIFFVVTYVLGGSFRVII